MEKTVTYRGAKYLVPEWVNYIAEDSDGDIYGYEFEPNRGYNGWTVSVGRCVFLEPSTSDWYDSLVKV